MAKQSSKLHKSINTNKNKSSKTHTHYVEIILGGLNKKAPPSLSLNKLNY